MTLSLISFLLLSASTPDRPPCPGTSKTTSSARENEYTHTTDIQINTYHIKSHLANGWCHCPPILLHHLISRIFFRLNDTYAVREIHEIIIYIYMYPSFRGEMPGPLTILNSPISRITKINARIVRSITMPSLHRPDKNLKMVGILQKCTVFNVHITMNAVHITCTSHCFFFEFQT